MSFHVSLYSELKKEGKEKEKKKEACRPRRLASIFAFFFHTQLAAVARIKPMHAPIRLSESFLILKILSLCECVCVCMQSQGEPNDGPLPQESQFHGDVFHSINNFQSEKKDCNSI